MPWQCMGDEMKNFGKDTMETHSGECGFILYWPKCRNVLNQGGNRLGKSIMCDGECPIYSVLVVFCL